MTRKFYTRRIDCAASARVLEWEPVCQGSFMMKAKYKDVTEEVEVTWDEVLDENLKQYNNWLVEADIKADMFPHVRKSQ